jgi:hypothetical protein
MFNYRIIIHLAEILVITAKNPQKEYPWAIFACNFSFCFENLAN